MADELIPSGFDRIFYKSEKDRYNRGETQVARAFAKAFPQLKIVITMGPYRGYDYCYELNKAQDTLEIDFYSVRLPSKEYVNSGIAEVAGWLK